MNRSHLISVIIAAVTSLSACDNDDAPDHGPSRYHGEITVDGRTRTYLVQTPAKISTDTKIPLVIMLHGTGGSASQAERDYGWSEKASVENFIVVYPEGVPGEGRFRIRTWNAGKCCQYAMDNGVDDVKFMDVLLDELIRNYPVDASRVYVIGMSNGAMLAYRLACEMSGRLAAVGAVSGTMMVENVCNPSRTVPVVHIHSSNDTKVPYEGGQGLGGYYFTPVDSAIGVMKGVNGCSQTATTEHPGYAHQVISDCTEETVIERFLLEDGGHSWPGGRRSSARSDVPSTVINATDIIWQFFIRYERREH